MGTLRKLNFSHFYNEIKTIIIIGRWDQKKNGTRVYDEHD